ncbi:hypothetical protein KGP26_03620 [Serratia sp. JSRIV002]|uniref:hypothetical protein n=1 Tax=Serratia sp. JSRIV002 TaxID=2831894 RepID=UPI001CBE17C5|nr:hypothetical protein [Serratia sp. JSRIV002]UAN52182.1 hypothetical protein KGP26_03620 [Serratia sp. JSRIV002]
MTDKLEALRLEAETLSGLMMQLAENEIDSDSFAVMSDLGENGQEHDCDLPITETALRVSAVIDQLLAALEEKERIIDALAVLSREFTEANTRNFLRAVAAEQRLQQPIKLRKCDIGIACEFISEHVVVSLAAVMVEAATAGFKVEVEGE